MATGCQQLTQIFFSNIIISFPTNLDPMYTIQLFQGERRYWGRSPSMGGALEKCFYAYYEHEHFGAPHERAEP